MAEQAEELSVDSVRGFLVKNHGKVKQSDLFDHFRVALSNPQTREACKNILQLIATTKTEYGEKFLVLINNKTQERYHGGKKSNRPLFFRKDHSKSRTSLHHPPPRGGSLSDNEDVFVPRPVSIVSNESTDSGHGTELGSYTPKLPARSKHVTKKRGKNRSKSIESGESAELNIRSGVLPEEKEWFLAAASGRSDSLRKLLDRNPKLSSSRDFVFGYTALHWAAKLGRTDIINMMIQTGVDVHTKSHGGYTALHVAAMSGRDHVISHLIEVHRANIHMRDYSGKKPKDVVRETVCADVQRKLGRTVILAPDWVLTDLHARKSASMY